MMNLKVQNGDKVKVHYKGSLDDGTIFDSSEGSAPLEFEVGSGNIIQGFEAGVLGMEEGEEKTLRIPPEAAYGPHRDELVGRLPKEQVGDVDVQVGKILRLRTKDGEVFEGSVTKVEEDGVTLDLNHPLAGESLNFEIKLVAIEKP